MKSNSVLWNEEHYSPGWDLLFPLRGSATTSPLERRAILSPASEEQRLLKSTFLQAEKLSSLSSKRISNYESSRMKSYTFSSEWRATASSWNEELYSPGWDFLFPLRETATTSPLEWRAILSPASEEQRPLNWRILFSWLRPSLSSKRNSNYEFSRMKSCTFSIEWRATSSEELFSPGWEAIFAFL